MKTRSAGLTGVRARWLTLPLSLLLTFGACGEDRASPGTSPFDGSPPSDRQVSDADFRDPVIDAAPDAEPAVEAASEVGDASDAADAPSLRVEITIASPIEGGVASAQTKFTPEVDVVVWSPDGSVSDMLKDVSAEVIERMSKKVVASGKLNQIGFHTVPETSALVYNFAESPIDIATALSGDYDLVITASTNGGRDVKATRTFKIDAGPTINIALPIKDKPYKGSAPIDVTISDELFGPVSDVQMKVGQASIKYNGPGGPGGDQYTATLDFASFMPALEGEQVLTVRAKNKNGTESVQVRKFVSDSKGPTFKNAKPADGQLVGNVITISVELDDLAGILSSSVVAVVANGPGTEYTIPLRAPVAGDTMPVYSAVFDTRLLPFGESALFPTLSFRASDTLGNESLLTNVIWLDNRPPLAELDPPDLRLWAKTEGGDFACSWPFDPVGTDAADDGDIVPQLVDIRARVEDQGNDPLSGNPNYIPIASVESAQLLVLDDISQPLIVNTNPTQVGMVAADKVCDALNPALVPTTRPMTARDAFVLNLVPMAPSGSPDLTNYINPPGYDYKVGDDRVIGGLDWGCPGGDNSRAPDPICAVTTAGPKAKYLFTDRWLPRANAMTVILGYGGGGGASKMPSIWTIPKQESGATNPQCGGTQLDTLANFVNDGWACFAVQARDALGNKSVSRPFRLCVDKNADGMECPHKPIARVYDGTPLIVETVADHGLATGDEVKVSGITMIAMVNGSWKVTKIDDRRFSLDGSKTAPLAPGGDWVRPTPIAGSNPFVSGHVVKTADIPDCTGTVKAVQPDLVVDREKCEPWRTYRPGELRTH